jgi:tRNA G18 (ribose-2'-O)-methylase SpoU
MRSASTAWRRRVRHQGVVAQASALEMPKFIEDVLESIEEPPLLLVLDGVQDPHNLGACLRVADGAGAHAVIAPKDRSVGLTAARSRWPRAPPNQCRTSSSPISRGRCAT